MWTGHGERKTLKRRVEHQLAELASLKNRLSLRNVGLKKIDEKMMSSIWKNPPQEIRITGIEDKRVLLTEALEDLILDSI